MQLGLHADAVGGSQQVQHRGHDQCARERTDAQHQLLLPRGGADDVAGLEVLQVVTADRRSAAHHRADHDRSHRTQRRTAGTDRLEAIGAQQHHQHGRGEQDGGDGDARDRVVGRTDQAGQVGRDRNEQEAGDDHDEGHRDRHVPLADDGLVQGQQRQHEDHQGHQHPLHRQVALGVRQHRAAALAGGGKAALDAVEQRLAQRDQGPDTTDQHRADTQVAHLRTPDGKRGFGGRSGGDRRGQCRIGVHEERLVDRNGDVPGQDRAGHHHDADVEADDVAHAQQCRRQVGADEGGDLGAADVGRSGPGIGNQAHAAFRGQLDEGADHRRQAEDLQARARILTGLEHFGRGLAFRERKRVFDDHRTAQRHREQHTQQAAKAGDAQHPPVLEVRPVAHDHQRRDGEDHTGGDRRAGRSAGLHDVVFKDGATAQQAQHAHGYHRGGNGGGDGQACEQTEVGVCGRQHHRQHDGQGHCAEGELLGRSVVVHGSPCWQKIPATLAFRTDQVQRAKGWGRVLQRNGPVRGPAIDRPGKVRLGTPQMICYILMLPCCYCIACPLPPPLAWPPSTSCAAP
ncbi:Uncharacterised protein [Stenotrophomonas maltophilia]|nr:Uncharacterised protein [Stenotrophomonas maltophilia]